jgi:hypothetical protein
MFRFVKITMLLVVVAAALAGNGCAKKSGEDAKAAGAQAVDQATFASPEDAVAELIRGLGSRDRAERERLFGSGGADLLDSGDEVADRMAAEKFMEAYNQKHQLVYNDKKDSATLVIGSDDWPMPIPIVKYDADGTWFFDSEAGREEILDRRIGRNELNVMQTCKAIVDAQQEYAELALGHKGAREYARKFISDEGKKNGLYWPTADGRPLSPLGEFVAAAAAEGYETSASATGEPRPYHGYLYRILTAQGPTAPGGAMDYIVDGRLIGGFAIVAWPAEYGDSGVMTFIADYRGHVYQTDLGDNTAAAARAITAFDPGPQWKKAD